MSRLLFSILLSLGLPLFASVAIHADDAAKAKPATLAQIRDVIDWSKIPQPPGSQAARAGLSICSYKAPGTFLEAATFFRTNLPTLGWKEDATPIPGVDQQAYLYLTFDKGDMRLSINGFRADPKAPMTVTLSNNGNVDIRDIPKPADANFRSNGRLAAFFTTGSKPEVAADFCRKSLLERGWHEVPDQSAKFFAKEARIVLRFLQNAMEIGVVASKNDAGQTEVTISSHVRYKFAAGEVRKALTPEEIPTPASIKDYVAVLDLRSLPLMPGARKRDRQSQPIALSNSITCQAPGSLDDAIDFHRKELSTRGWKETRFDNQIDDRVELFFEKQGYLVTVNLGQQKKEDVQISVVNHGNVDLRQLPFPAGAEIEPERGTFVNSSTSVSENEAVEFFRTELAKLGWKSEKGRGQKVYLFLQNASILQIEIQKDADNPTTLKLTQSLFGVEK